MCAVGIPTELRGFVVHEKNLLRHCAVVADHVLVISSYLLDSGKDLDLFEFQLLRSGVFIKRIQNKLKVRFVVIGLDAQIDLKRNYQHQTGGSIVAPDREGSQT